MMDNHYIQDALLLRTMYSLALDLYILYTLNFEYLLSYKSVFTVLQEKYVQIKSCVSKLK